MYLTNANKAFWENAFFWEKTYWQNDKYTSQKGKYCPPGMGYLYGGCHCPDRLETHQGVKHLYTSQHHSRCFSAHLCWEENYPEGTQKFSSRAADWHNHFFPTEGAFGENSSSIKSLVLFQIDVLCRFGLWVLSWPLMFCITWHGVVVFKFWKQLLLAQINHSKFIMLHIHHTSMSEVHSNAPEQNNAER